MTRLPLALTALCLAACAPDKDGLGPGWDGGPAALDASPEDALDAGEATAHEAGQDEFDAADDSTLPDDAQTGALDAADAAGDAGAAAVDAGQEADGAADAGAAHDATLAVDASQPGDGGGPCAASSLDAATARPVDLIIALDTSGSMAPYFCAVADNVSSLASSLAPSAHIVSVYQMSALQFPSASLCGSADPVAESPLASDPTRYRHIPTAVDSLNSLSVLLAEFDSYKSHLRSDAQTHVLVVSDDDSALPAADFKLQMEQKLGHSFVFHAAIADALNACPGAAAGTQYATLADETVGSKESVCSASWPTLSAHLASVSCSLP